MLGEKNITTVDHENEIGAIATAVFVSLYIIMFLIIYLNKWTVIKEAWDAIKLKIINATTRRSFQQLDTVYYTDDDQVGVNLE
ncbi:gp016L [Rabbit fibroma virus]|uniref:Gp016L n=1 Tax=Rabbit fibroma virus (strain Kasza) TaxID=10272 RepID=Q9Q954_RFVKA|nr:gp016L [Rabbit fibroma virus]AAF17900.1 gp016L [Rabbit fibroma virus]